MENDRCGVPTWLTGTWYQSIKQGECVWMKQTGKKYLVTLLSALLAISVMLNVASAASLVEITAYLNNEIKIMLNGKLFEPKLADGTKVVPITYNGTTYLPLRAISEAVGLETSWDGGTKTVYLGEKGGQPSGNTESVIRVTPEYTRGGEKLYRVASRTPEYLNRAPNRSFEYGYAGEPDYYAGITLFVPVNYEYKKFRATFWIDEEKDEEGNYKSAPPVIEFKEESNQYLLKRINAAYGNLYEVELDIEDVHTLQIWAQGSLTIIGEPVLVK
jgi:hypothetical protein